MPIYEFKCSKCGEVFEYLQFKSDDKCALCPSCKFLPIFFLMWFFRRVCLSRIAADSRGLSICYSRESGNGFTFEYTKKDWFVNLHDKPVLFY